MNIFRKSIFDVPDELREVGVVIMKKETEGSFVCKAKYYGELAKHKSRREKRQQIKYILQSLFKRVELKQSG